LSRDIGDACVNRSLETPAFGRGLVVGCTSTGGPAHLGGGRHDPSLRKGFEEAVACRGLGELDPDDRTVGYGDPSETRPTSCARASRSASARCRAPRSRPRPPSPGRPSADSADPRARRSRP